MTEKRAERLLAAAAWWILRILFAAVTAYAFIVVMLVATAQQRVDDALAKEKVGYDYSVAVRYFLDSDQLTQRATANSNDLQQAQRERRNADREVQVADRELATQLAILRQLIGTISATCGIAGASPSASAEELVAAAGTVQDCLASVPEPNPAAADLKARSDKLQRSVEAALDNVTDKKNKVEDLDASLKLLQAERDNTQGQIAAAARSKPLLEILRIFENSWWMLNIPLIRMPPALTAIILSSLSEMFGALIVTLVLFVYPDNEFKFAKSASYFGRIFLGGVIALGVFVVMFSGVAVLAGPQGAGSAQNLMAYAAIGLLAGMFSDKAAKWLSERPVFSAGGGGSAGAAGRRAAPTGGGGQGTGARGQTARGPVQGSGGAGHPGGGTGVVGGLPSEQSATGS